MDDRGWLIQIYRISDAAVQEAIRTLLAGIESLTVQTTRSGRDLYLVVECHGDEQAWCIHRFITSADPEATLIHTSTGVHDQIRHRPPVEPLLS